MAARRRRRPAPACRSARRSAGPPAGARRAWRSAAAHGDRIGVVALVDQGEARRRRRRTRRSAPRPSSGSKLGQRRQAGRRAARPAPRSISSAARLIQAPVRRRSGAIGKAQRAGRAAAPATARAVRLAARSRSAGRRSPRPRRRCAPRAPRARAAPFSSSNQRLSAFSTATPPGSRPVEDLGLGAGHAGLAVGEVLDVDRADGGDRHRVRRDHAGQRRDLAGVVHADLEHRALGVARHAGQRQRHADVVVVATSPSRAPRPASARPARDRLGDAGLADRAGDRAAPGRRRALARRDAQRSSACSVSSTIDRRRRRPAGRQRRRPRPAPGPAATNSWPSRSPARATNRSPGSSVRVSMETPVAAKAAPAAAPPVARDDLVARSRAAQPCAGLQAERRGGLGDVVERMDHAADDLALLVALAGHHQHVAVAQHGRRRRGSPRGGRRSPAGPGAPARISARMAAGSSRARIVVGDDGDVGQAGGDRAHQRPLAAVAVAAGAEDHDQPAARRAGAAPSAPSPGRRACGRSRHRPRRRAARRRRAAAGPARPRAAPAPRAPPRPARRRRCTGRRRPGRWRPGRRRPAAGARRSVRPQARSSARWPSGAARAPSQRQRPRPSRRRDMHGLAVRSRPRRRRPDRRRCRRSAPPAPPRGSRVSNRRSLAAR